MIDDWKEYVSPPFLKVRFLFLVLATPWMGCVQSETGANGSSEKVSDVPPNIVLILVDDLGKEWISCYGAEDINTPNIDALAAKGWKFNNAYCMPQCTPSRVTLLTGQYPFRHGWVNHWDVPRWGGGAHFDQSLNNSLGVEMKKLGYATCIAGKWQIDDFRVEPEALIKNGFDSYFMWTGYETGVPESAERYWDPYIYSNGGSQTYTSQFGPDAFRAHIKSFIIEHAADPFFVYYPMVLTHTPLVSTPDQPTKLETDLEKHKAMVQYTDKIVGQIVDVLEDLQQRDNTMIIFTTDNGTTRKITGNRLGVAVRGAKSLTSEPGVCIPFIVSWPGRITEGTQTDALVDFTDLLPTLIEAGGGDHSNLVHTIDGQSFYPLLVNQEDHVPRKWIMSMGGGNHARLTEAGVENQYLFRDRVVRNHRYKMYVNSNREAAYFYDLVLDPLEKNNILDSLHGTLRSEQFNQLLRVAKSFPEKDNDPVYRPNPPQTWDVEITAESKVWKL